MQGTPILRRPSLAACRPQPLVLESLWDPFSQDQQKLPSLKNITFTCTNLIDEIQNLEPKKTGQYSENLPEDLEFGDIQVSLQKLRDARTKQESKIMEWQTLSPAKTPCLKKRKLIRKLMARGECYSPLRKVPQSALLHNRSHRKKEEKEEHETNAHSPRSPTFRMQPCSARIDEEPLLQKILMCEDEHLSLTEFAALRIEEEELGLSTSQNLDPWNAFFQNGADYLGIERLMF